MRAYKRRSAVTLMVILALMAIISRADFEVAQIAARAAGETVALSGTFEFGLTAKVEEALSKGIPLDVIIDIKLYRKRSLLWDSRIQDWVLRRKISYHALSGQYLVTGHGSDPDAIESFISLQAALSDMGALNDVTLPLERELKAGRSHYVSVRAALDIESLPTPLRPVAYTSLAWRLNSGWTRWHLQP